jgi:hypothetical protein
VICRPSESNTRACSHVFQSNRAATELNRGASQRALRFKHRAAMTGPMTVVWDIGPRRPTGIEGERNLHTERLARGRPSCRTDRTPLLLLFRLLFTGPNMFALSISR